MYSSHRLRVFKVSEITNYKLSLTNSHPLLTCITIHEFNERFNTMICEFPGFLFWGTPLKYGLSQVLCWDNYVQPSGAGSNAWPPSRPEGSAAHSCLAPSAVWIPIIYPYQFPYLQIVTSHKTPEEQHSMVLARLDMSPSLWKNVPCFRCLDQFLCQSWCVVS